MPAKRVCLDCPALIERGKRRCFACSRRHDKSRGTKAERGYGRVHVALRKAWAQRIQGGEPINCWRCGKRIASGDAWTLGHCDIDRTKYHGPECPPCDYATSGRSGCPHGSHK